MEKAGGIWCESGGCIGKNEGLEMGRKEGGV